MCNNGVIAIKSDQNSVLFFNIRKKLFMCAVQDPVVAGKLKAAAGLAFLQAKKYKQAAKSFTEVGSGCSLFFPMINTRTSKSTWCNRHFWAARRIGKLK